MWTQLASLSKGTQPPSFRPMSTWPNGWMDQDATGTKVGLGPGHTVLHKDPAPSKRGTAPNFRLMSIVAKRSPISATAEYLLLFWHHELRYKQTDVPINAHYFVNYCDYGYMFFTTPLTSMTSVVCCCCHVHCYDPRQSVIVHYSRHNSWTDYQTWLPVSA